LSDTTFLYETTRHEGVRVSLIMDFDEVDALMDVASAAVHAGVMLPDYVDENTTHNAQQVYNWAMKAAANLHRVTELSSSADEQE
jgi:hypothetical protein